MDRQKKLRRTTRLSDKQSALLNEDFIYIAFESKAGTKISVKLKVTGKHNATFQQLPEILKVNKEK